MITRPPWVTLHCTRKLLRRMGVTPRAAAAAPVRAASTRLGDYHVNVLFGAGRPLALFTSERTLLSVLVPMAPASTLAARLGPAVGEVLTALGIDPRVIASEVSETADATVRPAWNLSVLASMRDLALGVPFYLEKRGSLLLVSLQLATTPCGPIGMQSPGELTKEILASAQGASLS